MQAGYRGLDPEKIRDEVVWTKSTHWAHERECEWRVYAGDGRAVAPYEPVCGLRPGRASRVTTSKMPKPVTRTSSPALAASTIVCTRVSIARLASALGNPMASATFSTIVENLGPGLRTATSCRPPKIGVVGGRQMTPKRLGLMQVTIR
jgi:hypothetical protein